MCLQAETAEPLIYYVGDSYSGRGWGAGGGVGWGVFRVVHLLCERGSTRSLNDRMFTETHMKGKMAPRLRKKTHNMPNREESRSANTLKCTQFM